VAGPDDEDDEDQMIDNSIARLHDVLTEEEVLDRMGSRPGREPDLAAILRMLQVISAQLEQRRAAIAANSIVLPMLPQTAQLDAAVAARLAANSIPGRGNETTRALAGKIAAAIIEPSQLLRPRR
jgi:hypothetical protein